MMLIYRLSNYLKIHFINYKKLYIYTDIFKGTQIKLSYV